VLMDKIREKNRLKKTLFDRNIPAGIFRTSRDSSKMKFILDYFIF